MKAGVFKSVLISGIVAFLSACGTDEPGLMGKDTLCRDISDSIYYTKTLEVGGLTLDGASQMHWSVTFDGTDMTFRQTDTVEVVPYACADGVITSAAVESVDFSKELQDVTIVRNGSSVTYALGQSEPNFSSCAEVAERHYVLPSGGVNKLIAPASSFTSVKFGMGQEVTLTATGGQVTKGIFECTGDAMHIHRYVEDINPIIVTVERHGASIELNDSGNTTLLVEKDGAVSCTAEYKPVCSVASANIQCLVAPCPVGFYETASNRCVSDAKGLLFQQEGECGELEGQPFYDLVACTKEYRPVCGAVVNPKPCGDVPCPKRVYKTFGNLCEANAAKAVVTGDDECGKSEGQVVEGTLPGACTAQYDPVCGKVDKNIVCITAPCPAHQYETFGNQCAADLAQASTVFTGECGSLDGILVEGQPPIQMVDTLPKVTKSIKVIEAKIDGDILSVTVGYSGCDQQHMQLMASSLFLESNPVQTEVALVPVVGDDSCDAYFTTQFQFDLLPLKATWQKAYQQSSGTIILRNGFGTYRF